MNDHKAVISMFSRDTLSSEEAYLPSSIIEHGKGRSKKFCCISSLRSA